MRDFLDLVAGMANLNPDVEGENIVAQGKNKSNKYEDLRSNVNALQNPYFVTNYGKNQTNQVVSSVLPSAKFLSYQESIDLPSIPCFTVCSKRFRNRLSCSTASS